MTRTTRGVTLLELLAAVAVLSVLVGLAGMSFQRAIEARRANNAVRELFSQALKARQAARATNQPVRFSLRFQTVDGHTLTTARWERLPCADPWGNTCPTVACQGAACGASGCDCAEVGPEIELPAAVDGTALDGLCFLGGTGKPRRRLAGADCLEANPAPAAADIHFDFAAGPRQFLVLEPLTGLGHLVDCGAAVNDPALCP